MGDTMTDTGLQVFSVRDTPLLSSGSTMEMVARAPGLWMHVKVYADGGENGLHCHPKEDHLFFVLQGEATFFDADGDQRVVGTNEGVVVPRGTLYSFQATGASNLVLLRVGSPTDSALGADSQDYPGVPKATLFRAGAGGAPFHGDSKENKTGGQKGVPSGALFGAGSA
jgi:mannose-6-phosphate isomerase-like protein (cupin superfamily)